MDRLKEALNRSREATKVGYTPTFFRSDDRAQLEELLAQVPEIEVFDGLGMQLQELVRSLYPSQKFSKEELVEAAQAHLRGTPSHEYGVWVYYPWSRRLVHLLDEAEFALVRTDRNRNKITREEQAILHTKKIGVIGLSVGQSVSLTLALERSFGEIRLADFDTLELSNLNRIRSGVHQMGVNKAINVAREIAEIDPFLKVVCFTDGITKENIDRFFTEGGKLDMLVEECDSVDIKIIARQKAKALGIPVVMDMSDRGCLDVERFDLEPDRPIMHGWIDHLDLEAASRPMTNEEKIPFMLPIVGTDTLSTRMKASMIEMGQTVGTWPQLASSVVLGGAITGDTCRRIALDQLQASGRWYVDLENTIAPEAPPTIKQQAVSPKVKVVPFGTSREMGLPELPVGKRPITEDEFVGLVEAGALAPSAGNMQPWKFQLHEGRLLLLHDLERSASRWDPDHLMAHIALGACLENIHIEARSRGMVLQQLPVPVPEGVVAILEAEDQRDPNGSRDELELVRGIRIRCTNRKVVAREEIPSAKLLELGEVVEQYKGCRSIIFDTQEQLDELAGICSSAERIRILDPIGHKEFFEKEVRWTKQEAETMKDGLDLATMEFSPGDAAALRIASDPKAIALVSAWGGGKALEKFSSKGIRTASAVLLVLAPGDQLPDRLVAARAAQRAWIKGNLAGIAMHPISAPIFMFHAAKLLPDLPAERRTELAQLEDRFSALVKSDTHRPLFMLRLTLAGEPTVRSVRRSIKDLIINHAIPAEPWKS